jgi:hypothetical protein
VGVVEPKSHDQREFPTKQTFLYSAENVFARQIASEQETFFQFLLSRESARRLFRGKESDFNWLSSG